MPERENRGKSLHRNDSSSARLAIFSELLMPGRVFEYPFALAVLCLGSLAPANVLAIGLDEISRQSALGEPLRLVIPVIANAADEIAGDDLGGECFKVVPAAANDVPQLKSARVTLERRGPQAFVVLTTAYPIAEPIMRVAVQAGCRMSINREYTVLFDPVSIEPPAAQVASAPMPETRPAEPATELAAQPPTPALAAAPRQARSQQRAQSTEKGAASAPRAKPRTGVIATRPAAEAIPTAVGRAPKVSTGPRLQISRTTDDGNVPAGATRPKAVSDRETLMALEEHAVVLQRQIAELSVQMERIDAELRAAAAEKTSLAATARAAVSPTLAATSWWTSLRGWLSGNWLQLVLVPALLGLVGALFVTRRREHPLIPRPLTAAQAESFNAGDLGEPSVPGGEPATDREAAVASIKDRPKAHMIPPVFVDPIEPDKVDPRAQTQYEQDPGISFDEEVRKAYEQASDYSVLEREEPGFVERLIEGWGTPRATAQLDNYLLTPRRNGKSLSRGAVEELKLLQSIAMEQVADLNRTPWIGNLRTPPGTIAGTH